VISKESNYELLSKHCQVFFEKKFSCVLQSLNLLSKNFFLKPAMRLVMSKNSIMNESIKPVKLFCFE